MDVRFSLKIGPHEDSREGHLFGGVDLVHRVVRDIRIREIVRDFFKADGQDFELISALTVLWSDGGGVNERIDVVYA
ncbi:MAG: hypothetical protein UW16_C0038G0004 [Microgenomates group bacterium GW2011_GWC1_44_10]|nr:MAG: hypothetical protein UW16_C0038G0004 [Microgenomates group bacterium GW2011_GWC1_44_10]